MPTHLLRRYHATIPPPRDPAGDLGRLLRPDPAKILLGSSEDPPQPQPTPAGGE